MKFWRSYKTLWFSLLLIWLGTNRALAQTQQFFPVEPTGLPYHVIINELLLNPQVDGQFEIGLFTDSLCVGRGVTNSPLTNIDIVAWEGEPGYDLAGFTVGDTIQVRIATQVFDTLQVMSGNVTPVIGNGTFGDGTYTVIAVNANLYSYPTIDIGGNGPNLSFGNIYLGATAQDSLVIRNVGTSRLHVFSNYIPDGFNAAPTDFALSAGDSQVVAVTFQPYAVRDYDDFLVLGSNDPNTATTNIHLRGTGARPPTPHLTVDFEPGLFNHVAVNQPVRASLILANAGDSTLTISGIETTNSVYQVQDTSFTLAAGQHYITSVVCNPPSEGYYSGELRIFHNAPNLGNPVSISIPRSTFSTGMI